MLKTRSVALAAFLIAGAAGCDMLDVSKSSCDVAEGRCIDQCRRSPGAGQADCEDQRRVSADQRRAS
ncbi:MAG: hypothetical protein HXY23_05685 [Parvularculaceae bacterium]|nr:hypothetical protein [Parvularculaceae bacterium]